MSDDFVHEANLLCLDLVNTQLMRNGEPVDLLVDFDALLNWLESADVLHARDVRAAKKRWSGTLEAKTAFRTACNLRQTVKAATDLLMAGRPVGAKALNAINAVLASLPTVTEVRRANGGYERVARRTGDGPVALLAPVLESAVDLLTSLDVSRLSRCGDENCILYYYDTSKNRSRRWCSMERCGNRAKAAAHYKRHGRTG